MNKPEYKLEIWHGGELIRSIDTDDADSVREVVDGFEYELDEMVSGAANDE